jgi:hypothetical protein
MAIIGLTDQRKGFDSLGRIEISVFKGGRKSERSAGADLKNLLRITTTNKVVPHILKQYSPPDSNGDYFAEALNIYLPYDEVDRTFNCSMKLHSASGLEIVCDRHTISKRCTPETDAKGNVWRPLVDVEEPCPMRDKGFAGECPNKCVKEGQFVFYIRELLDRDLMLPARLTVHGFEDLTYLTTKLAEYAAMFGSLTRSPFPAHQYRHKIPFILSRTEVAIKRPIVQKSGSDYLRTGKKTSGTTHALTLQIDPIWMDLYRRWQLIEEMKFRQLPISQSAVLGLLRGDTSVIDAEVVREISTTLALPSRLDRMRSRIQQLATEYERLTNIPYEVPDLGGMNEEAIAAFGKELKSTLDAIKLKSEEI